MFASADCKLRSSAAHRTRWSINQSSLPCLVDDGLGQDRQEALTVVVGKSFDPQLQRYFIYVCETMLRIVGNNPTFAQVTQAMQRLIDLFRKLALPSTRSVAGLVGELSIILRSRNAVVAAEAWRSEADNRFDFAYADARLVKATSMRRQIHNLSLEQCGPPEGTRGLLVSVFIETIGGGFLYFTSSGQWKRGSSAITMRYSRFKA